MDKNTVTQVVAEERETTTTSITIDAQLWRSTKILAIQRRMSALALIEEGLRLVLEKTGQAA